jgi:hypothetical protein
MRNAKRMAKADIRAPSGRLNVGEGEAALRVHGRAQFGARLAGLGVQAVQTPVLVVPPALRIFGRVVVRHQPHGGARIVKESAFTDFVRLADSPADVLI